MHKSLIKTQKLIKENLNLFVEAYVKSKASTCSNTAKQVTELQEDARKQIKHPNDGYVETTPLV